jgi:uncharacterized protein
MPRGPNKRYSRSELDALFERACKQEDKGKLRSAFRLLLTAAKAGDISSQINLGNFYSHGTGVKPNRTLALYWYRRAYRRGERSAASNIGAVFRDEENWKQALKWFERAVRLEDGDASLDIAKIYLRNKSDHKKAIRHLKQTLKAKVYWDATKGSQEEAQRLLKRLQAPKRRS